VEGLVLQLAPEEEVLFDLLLRAVVFNGKNSTLRVAGGWVRDRMLQKASNDIDIALDDQSGIEFANGVNAYLQSLGMETRTIAVIQANPDQSKHLETANLRVMGFEIDCVHLRAETYSDTRIPEIRVGTALEDALRRDFNINALFYNINKRCVEDFTGRGVSDLQQKLLCTPLSADITFRDDPLRVLRAIRFASRLNYTLHPDLIAAARHPEIRMAMQNKVSRERICKEIDGMLVHGSARPALSALLLHHLHMLDVCLPLHLYLHPQHSVTICAAGSVPTNHQYRVTRGCNPLCSLWFDKDNSFLSLREPQCPLCIQARPHNAQICRMSMSVEVVLWTHALQRQRQAIVSHFRCSTSEWLVTFRELLFAAEAGPGSASVWAVQPSDLLCEMHAISSQDESTSLQQNAKVLFWSGLLTVTAGICLQEAHHQPAAATAHHKQHHQQQSVKDVPLCERILRDQLKMDNHTAKNTQIVIDAAFSLLKILQLDSLTVLEHLQRNVTFANLSQQQEQLDISNALDILTVAQWLRSVKERWEDAVMIALSFIFALVHRHVQDGQYPLYQPFGEAGVLVQDALLRSSTGCFQQLQLLLSRNATNQPIANESALLLVIVDRFAKFIHAIAHHRLQDIWLLKPLLDGGTLQKRLDGRISKGPMIGKLMEAQLLWLIEFRFVYPTVEDTVEHLVVYLREVLDCELLQPAAGSQKQPR
jgi:hypothetical protein